MPYEDVAKGYELPDGEIVVLDDDDLADLPLPSTKAIEVLQFTPAEQLDPILYNKSYYVEPEGAGARAYVLLRDALEQSGKVAVAQVALRQRESLATLRAKDGVLVLETLLWPDEVREAAFPFLQQDIEVRPQELTMAATLIDSMTADFEPDAYHDNYREALIEVVEAKVQGRELAQPAPLEIAAGETTSLAEALRASLAAAQQPGKAGGNGGRAKAIGGADGSRSDSSRSGSAGGSRSDGTGGSRSSGSSKARSGPAKTGRAKGEAADVKPGSAKASPARKPARKAS